MDSTTAATSREVSATAAAPPLDTEAEQFLRTTVHEAGHAVAGVVLRLGLVRVSVVPTEARMGVCEVLSRRPSD